MMGGGDVVASIDSAGLMGFAVAGGGEKCVIDYGFYYSQLAHEACGPG